MDSDSVGTGKHAPVSKRQAQAARLELEQALSFHFRGEKASALKSFRIALNLDPGLASETLSRNLAKELTGLPAAEAVESLTAEQTAKELVQTARRQHPKPGLSVRRLFMTMTLALALLTLAGLSIWALRSGTLASSLSSFRRLAWERHKHTLEGYEYYALVPPGSPPPQGWPVVVALHGYNGESRHMLPFAQAFLDQGVLFIAPGFGGYEPWPKGPLEVMSRILDQVAKEHPLQERGAVLLGHSQGGTFAYRFSVYYPHQVAGVVTAGAPEFDALNPARRSMPYVITYGEYDFLQEFMLPPSFALRNNGFNVSVYIVEGAEHEMTQFALEKALKILTQR